MNLDEIKYNNVNFRAERLPDGELLLLIVYLISEDKDPEKQFQMGIAQSKSEPLVSFLVRALGQLSFWLSTRVKPDGTLTEQGKKVFETMKKP